MRLGPRPHSDRIRPYQVGLILLALLFIVPFSVMYARGLERLRSYEVRQPLSGATLLDRRGQVIAVVGSQNRTYVPITAVPKELQEAVVDTEDARFYKHFGVDPVGIGRALVANLRAGHVVQGASTITQQVAKNVFLTPERTIRRKLEELVMAFILEGKYSKDEILEMYLNSVYFGEGVTGVGAAALTYFGKPVSQLTLGECALLAGLPQAPSRYSPYRDPQAALARRRVVLDRMVAEKHITPAQADAAAREPLRLERRSPTLAPYFVDWVTDLLLERYTPNLVYRGGLRVLTTLDLRIQEAAEAALASQPFQGAIVAVDPATGGILAMVGGRDYAASQFNRAVQARRQPGSAMKPFIYAVALEQGATMADTPFIDQPININGYAPANFKNEYLRVPVTLKHALVESINSIAVQLLQRIGIDPVYSLAQRAGLGLQPADRTLALALGGVGGVSPLQMAEAYTTFATGGLHRPVYAISRVTTSEGRVLESYTLPAAEPLLRPETSYLLTNMLVDVVRVGTGKQAGVPLNIPAAGKTGTSDERTNAWFAGYTPNLTAVVYIGNDDMSPLGLTGGLLAAPVWGMFVRTVYEHHLQPAPSRFMVPPGVTTGVPIDWQTGAIATTSCPPDHVEWDAFLENTLPEATCPLHRGSPLPVPGPSSPPAGIMPAPATPAPAPELAPVPTPAQPDSGLRPDSSRPLPPPILWPALPSRTPLSQRWVGGRNAHEAVGIKKRPTSDRGRAPTSEVPYLT
ncbi:MAG: PBP1A family penicillin-binding protein [Limnochordaceae bacterium]|nr:PBP1A family penicillin-binding protein [Limnochordaceae bacterium]